MASEPHGKRLGDLLQGVSGARLANGSPEARVVGITHDTRRLQPGELFVAVPGLERDGLEFVPQALAGGASAIVAEQAFGADVPVAVVPSARGALAELSAAFYDHPSRSLPVVGITGTDGKTSTTHLLSAILQAHGLRTGWLTTVNTKIGAELRSNAADHTTPEAPVVQQTLAEMRDASLDVALLEVSSHALALDRVHAVEFDVGVFTNLSQEHLNFHGTFDAYREAKSRLFGRLGPSGVAVLNADDPSTAFMRSVTSARVLTYSAVGSDRADLWAADIALSPRGTSFTLHPAGIRVESQLIGRFNVANWLAAYAAATVFGASLDDLVVAATRQPPVPGRMNLVQRGQPFAVVVDFAHTPQALEKALETVRDLGARRVLLAFGMAGGRDAANRPIMGQLAAEKSDRFVVTTDDPGQEDPADIAQQVARGAAAVRGNFEVQLDRREAIRALLREAQAGDVVLLAGKGHERRMVLSDGPVPWNDAEAAASELEALGYHEGGAAPTQTTRF